MLPHLNDSSLRHSSIARKPIVYGKTSKVPKRLSQLGQPIRTAKVTKYVLPDRVASTTLHYFRCIEKKILGRQIETGKEPGNRPPAHPLTAGIQSSKSAAKQRFYCAYPSKTNLLFVMQSALRTQILASFGRSSSSTKTLKSL